jgi:hypothetical protein
VYYTNLLTRSISLTLSEAVYGNTSESVYNSSGKGITIFVGGNAYAKDYHLSTVESVTQDLVKNTPTSLPYGLANISSSTFGTRYALFGGGLIRNSAEDSTTPSSNVYCFDSNLVCQTLPSFDTERYSTMCTSVGEYIIFAGGYDGNNSLDSVDVYTTNLDFVKK